MNKLDQLHWPLIIGMGALALIRPLMNITGLMEGLGRPFGPILLTVLISLAWLAIVVFLRVRQPLLTLIFTGVTYGVFAFVLGAILSPILIGELFGPLANPFIFPFALVSVLVTNAIWGAVIGLFAWGIQRLAGPQKR
jgi:hypothetical protein